MKKFHGNARFLMFLCRDIRRRWMQYGENRLYSLSAKYTKCVLCNKRATQWDHVVAVGRRPYTIEGLVDYIKRMLYNKTQPLCQTCNSKKADK